MFTKKHNGLLYTLMILVLFLSAFSLHAKNSPVKSVDAKGNVTYSDKPVAGAEQVTKIPIHPGPSTEEIETAQQQAQKKIQTAEEITASQEAAKKLNTPPAKPKKEVKKSQPDIILGGSPNRPLYGIYPIFPGLRPPTQYPLGRPGINPPLTTLPIARPQAGGARQ